MDHTIDELNTLADFVRWGTSRFNEAELFFGHGTDNALDEAISLVLHTLHLPNTIPETLWHTQLTYHEKKDLLQLFHRRIDEHIPLPYLINEAWFANLRFYVDERVLIPRSPTAELILQGFEPWVNAEKVDNVLDLCTGSACIAIAMALTFSEAQVDAVDISEDALAVAERNIHDYALEERVHAVQSDLFDNLIEKRYDLIVSNPPYVDAVEMANLPDEYHHEPELGLASGVDGLDITKRILETAKNHLTDHGVLIVEVGVSQAAMVEQFPNVPFTWLELSHGGEGIFMLTAEQLKDL